jgi:hypothetical protein
MSPWQEWKKKNAERQASGKVSPLDFVNPDTEYASIDEINARYAVCEQCPKLLASKQCKECGCFMPLKTKLLHASCPLSKW